MSSLIYPEVDFSINAIPQLCYENVIYSLHSIKGLRQPSKGELVVAAFGDGEEKILKYSLWTNVPRALKQNTALKR